MTEVFPVYGRLFDMFPLEPQLVVKIVAAATINPKEQTNNWREDEEAKRIKPSDWHFKGRSNARIVGQISGTTPTYGV